jgi:hypothetical protein
MADKDLDAVGIVEFYNVAQQKEFSRKFQFRVQSLGPLGKDDMCYITTSKLPGKTIYNVKVAYMGLEFNIPGAVQYTGSDSWDVEIRADEGMNIRSAIDGWQRAIFNHENSGGAYGVPTQLAVLHLLGKDDKMLRSYTLHGIYPKSIGDIQYDRTNAGDVVTFTATFAYQFWTET